MSNRPDDDTCPECGEPLLREEADVGVGIIYGPPWCSDPACGWEPPQHNILPREEEPT